MRTETAGVRESVERGTHDADDPSGGARWPIEDLVGPYGVVARPRLLVGLAYLPPGMSIYIASAGDLESLRGAPVPTGVDGIGRAMNNPALARRIAICEAVERYAGLYGRPVNPIVATARELGDEALPLEQVARASATELRHPDCTLRLPDPDAKIRWTEGYELTRRTPKLVPLVMARLVPATTPGEFFWMPISTGCALHRTPPAAVLGGGAVVRTWRDCLVVRRLRPLGPVSPSADVVRFSLPGSTVTMRHLDPGVHAALAALDTDRVSIGELISLARRTFQDVDLARLALEIGRLYARGGVSLAVLDGEAALCELIASNRTATLNLQLGPEPEADPPDWLLSRFALTRRDGGALLVESLAAAGRLTLYGHELGAIVAALREPVSERAIAAAAPGLSPWLLQACVRVMKAGGVAGHIDRDGLLPEDCAPELVVREPHDLLLHNHSRNGLATGQIGGTFRFVGAVRPLPAVRPAWNGSQVPLPRPDLERLIVDDMPLTAAMETRRSGREWADRPLALGELGEFLFRVFRVKAMSRADPGSPQDHEVSLRPLPSAGAIHDLEVYVAAGRVADLGRGLFHYDPVRHQLTQVSGDGYAVSAILLSARGSSGCAAEPPAVVVLASRFGRLSWKYEGIAYAATLKNVGTAYGVMYLVATAMGLAGCALGSGDSSAFAFATGLSPHAEPSVGEFMIGPAESG